MCGIDARVTTEKSKNVETRGQKIPLSTGNIYKLSVIFTEFGTVSRQKSRKEITPKDCLSIREEARAAEAIIECLRPEFR